MEAFDNKFSYTRPVSASETMERTHLKLSNKFVRYNLSGMKVLLS